MALLLIVSLSVFLVAFVVGWRQYRSFCWNFVDLVYYPLAATGVLLLFLANDVQRELLEVSQLAEKQKESLDELRVQKPYTRVADSSQLLVAHLESIELVSRWGDICDRGPASSEPRCLAVRDFVAPIREFLKAARARFPTYEERLLVTCQAADKLVEALRMPQSTPSMVGEKLSIHFNRTIAKKLYWLDYDALDAAVAEFRTETVAYIDQIHGVAFKPDDSSGALLLSIRREELAYGEIVFRGLFSCMTAPRAELTRLSQWTATTNERAQELERLEAQRTRLRVSSSSHPAIAWIQFNLWPLVLLAALSLKFAKGAATLRKARTSISTT